MIDDAERTCPRAISSKGGVFSETASRPHTYNRE